MTVPIKTTLRRAAVAAHMAAATIPAYGRRAEYDSDGHFYLDEDRAGKLWWSSNDDADSYSFPDQEIELKDGHASAVDEDGDTVELFFEMVRPISADDLATADPKRV